MKILLMTAILLSTSANAGLFQSLASKIEGFYTTDKVVMILDYEEEGESDWVETTVTDELKIEKVTRRKIKFEMSTWFTNGHSCYMEGTAKKIAKNKFLYVGEKDFDGNTCKSEIVIDKEGIEFKDESGACKWNNCGMRGYIDGTRFEF